MVARFVIPFETHGAVGYREGCRCDTCTEGHRQRVRAQRARRAATVGPNDHGKLTTYQNAGCRCALCKAAQSKRQRELRARGGQG